MTTTGNPSSRAAATASSDRPRRGANDGDALRFEERPERGDDAHVVALLHALAVRVGGADRERDLDLAAVQLAADLEAGVLEDAQHRAVLAQHFRDEALDSRLTGSPGQLLEESYPDAASLEVVGDGAGTEASLAASGRAP